MVFLARDIIYAKNDIYKQSSGLTL